MAGILGARIWYAVRFLDVYLADPGSLFALNTSTIAPMEGALTGLLTATIYGQRKGLRLWPALDVLTPSLAAFAIAVSLANLASGDAFGAPAGVPWAIELWGAARHPSQVYELVFGGLVMLVVWRLRMAKAPQGVLFLTWAALAAGSRLFLEAFRGDSVVVLGSLRLAQIASLAILMAAMFGINRRTRQV